MTPSSPPAPQPEDSLRRRYLYKLAANLANFLINLAIQSIVPRALGPAAYGNFSFLTDFFSRVAGFFEMGSSAAFFTKLSQRFKEEGLFIFYLYVSAGLAVLVVAFLAAVLALGLERMLWPDQALLFIWLAAGWAVLNWFAQVLNKAVDAYGLTVAAEKFRVLQRATALALVAALFFSGRLGLTQYFLSHYLIFAFVGLTWGGLLYKSGSVAFSRFRLRLVELSGYAREFARYCYPLALCSAVAMLEGIFDRWMLQRSAGSVQQGFYGLSYQLGLICFLFTSAMTPLIMRDFSKAYGSGDLAGMKTLFERWIPRLYAVAAFFAAFLSMQAQTVGWLFGGGEFRGAASSIALMAFYPVHQTYGQLSGSVFLASGRTRLYGAIAIAMNLTGIALSYLLIAPASHYGLGLGSWGLAMKMVLIGVLAVNVQLVFNARFLKLSLPALLWHQAYAAGLMFAAAKASAWPAAWLGLPPLWAFLASGMIYSASAACLAWCIPSIFAATRQDLSHWLGDLRRLPRAAF